jgi:hypothetical protein
MKTKIFQGKDTFDLDTKMWKWRDENPSIKIIKKHPDERLPLNSRLPGTGSLTAVDVFKRQVDYED